MKPHLWLIQFIGVLVPRRLRADWRQEWEAELRCREALLAEWDRLNWQNKLDLLWRSTSAFWDALWLQPRRLEDEMFQDLRYGVRMLLKQKGFTAVAVLTLALGIGANTAIFSVVNALLLRPLPYTESERLALLAERSRDGERQGAPYPNFADWRVRAQSFAGMAATHSRNFNLTGGEKALRLDGRASNWNFFQLLGVTPRLGRLFAETDDRFGAARTVILSHGFWQQRFGAEANVIGQSLALDGDAYTVIGVLPPGFEYFEAADVYVPIELFLAPNSPMAGRGNSYGDLYAVARLKPGLTVSQANSEMAALGGQLAREYPEVNKGKSAQAERLQDVMSENVRQSLWVLLGAVGFILLIACINVANLLLVRAAERQKELAVRLALGAGRGRIVRQLLSESLLVAGLGGACGLLVGRWMLQGLLALAPPEIPGLSRVGLDTTVLLFTLGIAALTSLLFGLLPALQASKADLQTALKEGGRLTTGASREGMRKALLIAEVSLSLVLLVGAGLVVRTHANPLALAASVERAIHSIDKDLPVYRILTMDQWLGNSLAQRRLTLVLLASFAVLALLLAGVGIYGVISYAVKQRTHELGIRMALGARTRDVLTLILAQGLKLALVGIGLGLVAAVALTFEKLILFEAFGLAALVLAAIGIYGVLSGSVTERTREIGVRLALGAQRSDVLTLILRQGVKLALGGVVIGLFAAWGVTRLLTGLLFGVTLNQVALRVKPFDNHLSALLFS